MVPILKWAGGKTQLLEFIKSNMPKEYNRYYEPFMGGGAVIFDIQPEEAIINDVNKQLMNLYIQVRDNPTQLLYTIDKLDSISCDKEYYYWMRKAYNDKIIGEELDSTCAALMIWGNKHCFNGLYRVNNKGLFNVPYNNKVNGKSVDADNLMKIASYLQKSKVSIRCGDFEEVCKDVHEGDFVYFDSPYIPVSKTADFTDYTKGGFSLKDHQRLAELFRYLDQIGAKLMLSNNDVPLIYELYREFNIKTVDVKRMINRNASKRVGKEVLVTNY